MLILPVLLKFSSCYIAVGGRSERVSVHNCFAGEDEQGEGGRAEGIGVRLLCKVIYDSNYGF